MSCKEITFRSVDGCDFGFWESDITYASSTVEVRFGQNSDALDLMLTNADPSITWDGSVLGINLTAAQTALLAVGPGRLEVTIISSGGARIGGPVENYLNIQAIPRS
jgi:hypothetical protein